MTNVQLERLINFLPDIFVRHELALRNIDYFLMSLRDRKQELLKTLVGERNSDDVDPLTFQPIHNTDEEIAQCTEWLIDTSRLLVDTNQAKMESANSRMYFLRQRIFRLRKNHGNDPRHKLKQINDLYDSIRSKVEQAVVPLCAEMEHLTESLNRTQFFVPQPDQQDSLSRSSPFLGFRPSDLENGHTEDLTNAPTPGGYVPIRGVREQGIHAPGAPAPGVPTPGVPTPNVPTTGVSTLSALAPDVPNPNTSAPIDLRDLNPFRPSINFVSDLRPNRALRTSNFSNVSTGFLNRSSGIPMQPPRPLNTSQNGFTYHPHNLNMNRATSGQNGLLYRPCYPNNGWENSGRNTERIWQWDLKFSGDKPNASASEFLQSVMDRCMSRNVSREEVLHSMTELLEGTALRWFRSRVVNRPFSGWDEFVRRFLEDFEPYHESDGLLEMIRRLKQKSGESIVKYFSTVEDMFWRLHSVPAEIDRVNIIRKNLLPIYITSLSVFDFDTVESLKDACKKVECSDRIANTTVSSNVSRYPPNRIDPPHTGTGYANKPNYSTNYRNNNRFRLAANGPTEPRSQNNFNVNSQLPRTVNNNNNPRQPQTHQAGQRNPTTSCNNPAPTSANFNVSTMSILPTTANVMVRTQTVQVPSFPNVNSPNQQNWISMPEQEQSFHQRTDIAQGIEAICNENFAETDNTGSAQIQDEGYHRNPQVNHIHSVGGQQQSQYEQGNEVGTTVQGSMMVPQY